MLEAGEEVSGDVALEEGPELGRKVTYEERTDAGLRGLGDG